MTAYEHVPTLPELQERGLAEVMAAGKQGTFYRASPEGQRTIDDTMRRNAAWARAHPAESAQRLHDAAEAAKLEAATKKKK